jgi:cytochrome c-type biogenesis protein CcmH/NrfG
MTTRLPRILLCVSALLLSLSATSLNASVSDSTSAKDMLAAGRVDDVIAELNDRHSSASSDAESDNLLCRAYFALEEWDHAESSCKKAIALEPGNSRFICGWDGCTAKKRTAQTLWQRLASPGRCAANLNVPCN